MKVKAVAIYTIGELSEKAFNYALVTFRHMMGQPTTTGEEFKKIAENMNMEFMGNGEVWNDNIQPSYSPGTNEGVLNVGQLMVCLSKLDHDAIPEVMIRQPNQAYSVAQLNIKQTHNNHNGYSSWVSGTNSTGASITVHLPDNLYVSKKRKDA